MSLASEVMANQMIIKEMEDILRALGKGDEVDKFNNEHQYKEPQRFSDVVRRPNGTYVWIDSNLTIDHGYETMVFECDENGKVTNWGELDAEWYDTEGEMLDGHNLMVEKYKRIGD